MLNKEKFLEIMTGLADMYNKTITEFMLNIYFNIFQAYTDEQFLSAVNKTIKGHKYNTIPKPAEILEYLEGSKDDKALIAWMQVNEAIQKGGYYASVEFADPIIANCIMELGGWMDLCSKQKTEWPFIEKRFLDLYRIFLRRDTNKNIKLIGFTEAKNNDLNYPQDIPAPIRIGFEEQKQLGKEF